MSINFEIVFITAYDKYALKAFEVSALDYLLKPVDIDRLQDTIEKIKSRVSIQTSVSQLEILKDSIRSKTVTKIPITLRGNRRYISVEDVVAFEAQESYCNIHMKEGERLLVSKNLKYFEEILEEELQFFRSHKSWIVNLNFLKHYSKTAYSIELENNLVAKLSRYRISAFEEVAEKN